MGSCGVSRVLVAEGVTLSAAAWSSRATSQRGPTREHASASAQANACDCEHPWPQIRTELWGLFNPSVDVASLIDCASTHSCALHEPALQTAAELLINQQCSEEILPAISTRVCAAGMTHYMILCALQMWLRRIFRQSVLYFEHSFGFLALCLDCLEGSEWPLWPGQIIRNYQRFLEAAFPPGELLVEQKVAEGRDYIAAGPAVDPEAFRWWTGPREGLYCPPAAETWSMPADGFRQVDVPAQPPGSSEHSIMCAVPIVWPGEQAAAAAIAQTFGGECDELVFFIAAPDASTSDAAKTELGQIAPIASVVDLALEWPHMVRDNADALAAHGRRKVSGANQKDLLLFTHLASRGSGREAADWVCRIETDSYFAPRNFRRFVAGRGFNPAEPVFLGSISYWQMHFEPRVVFNEQVQCLSRAAVTRLASRVRAAPVVANVSYSRCELAPGHRGDLLLAICLVEAGIVPHRDIADAWGREYFLNYRLEDAALYDPEGAYGKEVEDPRAFATNAVQHWRGKAHIFLPCLGRREQIWASPYPISFHDYKDPDGIRYVHEVLTRQRECHLCPAGYHPRLADAAQ